MDIICESCGSVDYKVELDNQYHKHVNNNQPEIWSYSLLKCKNCGMGFINPKPSWSILQSFYDSNYGEYDANTFKPEEEAVSLKYKIAKLRYASYREHGLIPSLQTLLGRIVEILSGKTISYSLGIPLQLQKSARIFELGFGSGNWLLGMSHLGYKNLYGYDISANSENINRLKTAGINVTSEDFLKNEYTENSFDCIKLEHVFEHLLEPIEVMQRTHSMLKPNGILVMNFPGINSLSYKTSPQSCAHRESPRHLYLHTQISARNMLKIAGFKVESCKLYGVIAGLQATVNNCLLVNNIPVKIKGLLLFSSIYSLFCHMINHGEYITILATKRSE